MKMKKTVQYLIVPALIVMAIVRAEVARQFPPYETKIQACDKLDWMILKKRNIPFETVEQSPVLQKILYCKKGEIK
jgi:hypothetical protein